MFFYSVNKLRLLGTLQHINKDKKNATMQKQKPPIDMQIICKGVILAVLLMTHLSCCVGVWSVCVVGKGLLLGVVVMFLLPGCGESHPQPPT